MRCIFVVGFLFVIGFLSTSLLPAQAAEVTLITQDGLGGILPARLHVTDSHGDPFPGYPDSLYLSHGRLGGYFYSTGSVVMNLPLGVTEIGAMHGFEHQPFEGLVEIEGDTTLVITLPKRFGLREQGWYGGDMHCHTVHGPEDYVVSPHGVRRIAEAEDVRMAWVLDGMHEFTGGEHVAGTWEHIIYYSTEYRNQAYGHAALLGLTEFMGDWCCGPPDLPAYPMLTFTYDEWVPGYGQVMCLSHPHTGGEFFNDESWPGIGLGRELPVMAAMGSLDALELASYSNSPGYFLEDWYGLLNCGFRVSPAAGTDAQLSNYNARPLGGHRVYAYEGLDQSHAATRWVEALKAGRSFVTNFPLIPHYEVSGAGPGEELVLTESVNQLPVELRVESVFGLEAAELIFNGVPILSIPDPCQNESGVLDTTVTVTIEESGWLALAVTGQTDAWGPVTPELYAHTSPVYLQVPQSDGVSTLDAGRFLDWVDSLAYFVELRDHWGPGQRQEVLSTLAATRDVYRAAFRVPPPPFALYAPEQNAIIHFGEDVLFDWEVVEDPELGDRVDYLIEVAEDPDFLPLIFSMHCPAPPRVLSGGHLEPSKEYWWRVRAIDRGGNITLSTPEASPFQTEDWSSEVPIEDPEEGWVRPQAAFWPTPVIDRLHLQIMPPEASLTRLVILDSSGRVVCESQGADAPARTGLERMGAGHFSGRLRDAHGGVLATGRYWIQMEGHWADRAGAPQTWRQHTPLLIVR